MHHHHGHRGRHMLGGAHGHHGKMGKFGRHGKHGHHRGLPMLDGDCHKGKMMMKFGRHHGSCMQGLDEFHPRMKEMMRCGGHQETGCDVPHDEELMMKFGGRHHGHHMKRTCKKGNHHYKGKRMFKELFRTMMGYSSESDAESQNEETNQVPTQGTAEAPTMETSQDDSQTGGREEIQNSGGHCGGMMRFGRHREPCCHGSDKCKLKMKFGKRRGGYHKNKMMWKCMKGKQQHQEGGNSNSMRAIFMDMMCSGRRREMWEELARMMMGYESETEAEGQKEDTANEDTDKDVTEGNSQAVNMDIDRTGNGESNQEEPQSSGKKDASV